MKKPTQNKPYKNRRKRVMLSTMLACGCGNAALAAAKSPAITASDQYSFRSVAVVSAIAIAAFLILKKLARLAIDYLTTELQLTSLLPGLSPVGRREDFAEEADFSKLVLELSAGPVAAPRGLSRSAGLTPSTTQDSTENDDSEGHAKQLKDFFVWGPWQVEVMQELLKKSNQASGPVAQHDLLNELYQQAGVFKHRAGLPELRPAWHLATAIEGLLKQLVNRSSNITHSTLRTLAGGLELLRDLCAPGVRADLVTEPAIRILAVDDDGPSCFALCAALKKAFDAPDLAKSGEAALALARKQHYDLVILDVMMPGMDGFEVCTKIREIAPNRSTPVLFVTALKDFDSRAKSLAMGGNELMGKPFMAFEIAVKSVVLVLGARLSSHKRVLEASNGSGAGTPAVRWPVAAPAAVSAEDSHSPIDLIVEPDRLKNHSGLVSALPPAPVAKVPAGERAPEVDNNAPRGEASADFLSHMAASVEDMTEQIKAISRAEDGPIRLEMLVRLHLRLRFLQRKLDVPQFRPAFELCSALEGLLKKFKENPKNATVSALATAGTALEMLNDLCAPDVKTDLAHNPPIRILVVDDEPLARRAVTGALQTAFSRPATADSGEAALALAAERQFDLVFTDVCMPGMDGFALCSNLHKTAPNRATPVIFVTSHSDDDFRAESARCGGRDFVVKPFVFIEITVKALTFALRGRLEKLKSTQSQ